MCIPSLHFSSCLCNKCIHEIILCCIADHFVSADVLMWNGLASYLRDMISTIHIFVCQISFAVLLLLQLKGVDRLQHPSALSKQCLQLLQVCAETGSKVLQQYRIAEELQSSLQHIDVRKHRQSNQLGRCSIRSTINPGSIG